MSIIKTNGQFVPECFIKMKDLTQADRNYLICPTYNLGMYDVCSTCPLDCVKNPNQSQKSPIFDIVNLLGAMFGVDPGKKKEIDGALSKLNQPEFKEIYTSLERASKVIKDVIESKSGAPDITRKVLEVEAVNLKKAFGNMIKDGKITEEEARLLSAEVHSSENMQKLKTILSTMKKQYRET